MKRLTSEVIKALQVLVDKYGDLPFEVRNSDYACSYFDLTCFADTFENGGCVDEDDNPVIGIAF